MSIKASKYDWANSNWGGLKSTARHRRQPSCWASSGSPVPIYSTAFEELTHDKMEAVVYLGLRSYFA